MAGSTASLNRPVSVERHIGRIERLTIALQDTPSASPKHAELAAALAQHEAALKALGGKIAAALK